MSGLTMQLGWTDVTLRLGLTVIVGVIIGYDRSEHGKAAGMRTALLEELAAPRTAPGASNGRGRRERARGRQLAPLSSPICA